MRQIASALVVVFLSAASFAQTVTHRVRVGHSVEDIDVMGKQVVVIDGYEVFATGKNGFTKLFDVRDAGATSHVNALTWIDSENLFAFIEPVDRSEMVLCDEKGRPMGTRAITYPPGFFPSHTEGITWLPKGTPFAGHLALVAYDDDSLPRIQILTTAGSVVHEILLGPPFDSLFVGSVDVFDADHLVVAMLPNQLYVIDYTGAVVNGPVTVYEASNVEAVVRTSKGVTVADYFSGRIYALDSNLQRVPQDDLHNAFGGKIRPDGIAWSSLSHRFVLTSLAGDLVQSRAGFSLPFTLDDPTFVFHPNAHGFIRARGVTYMEGEDKILLAHRNLPRALLLYDQGGKLLEQIDVSAVSPAPLSSVVFVPSTNEFYLRLSEVTPRLRVLSRTGAFVRDVDLSGTGATGFGPMTVDGSDLVISTNIGLIRVDLNGALLATYSAAPLRAPQLGGLTKITSGPDAGKFAVCDSSNAEVIVFTLP